MTGIKVTAFGVLLILATLNREMTGFLLLVSWMVLYGRRNPCTSLAYMLIAGCTFIGLREILGGNPSHFTLSYTWELNTTAWRLNNAILYHTILACLWLVFALRWRHAPMRLRRLWFALIPYLILVITLSIWQETRLYMPMVLLTLPVLIE